VRVVDYGWFVLIGIVLVVILFWKPISTLFSGVTEKVTNQESYEAGKAVFYSTTQWAGEESYQSCAMCHAPDFVPEEGKQIKMADYKPGEPHVLKNISKKYPSSMLSIGSDLYEQVMVCVTRPTRLSCGRVSHKAQFMQDLMVYVSRQ